MRKIIPITSDMLQVTFTPKPKTEEIEILLEGLSEEALKAKGLKKMEPYAFFIKEEPDIIRGGISGFSYYGCMYIDALWIHPTFRNQGYGTQLITSTEDLGKKRSCHFITVNTMDWEALPFYQRLGYVIEYQRSGYDNNSTLYFLKKELQ